MIIRQVAYYFWATLHSNVYDLSIEWPATDEFRFALKKTCTMHKNYMKIFYAGQS